MAQVSTLVVVLFDGACPLCYRSNSSMYHHCVSSSHDGSFLECWTVHHYHVFSHGLHAGVRPRGKELALVYGLRPRHHTGLPFTGFSTWKAVLLATVHHVCALEHAWIILDLVSEIMVEVPRADRLFNQDRPWS